jgi:hypothetical protein
VEGEGDHEMSESKITRLLDFGMRKVNALVFPIVGGPMQPAGWPDRFYSHTLWSGFLEMKYEGGVLSTIQRAVLRGLTERKVPAFVLRFIDWQDGKVTVHLNNVYGDRLSFWRSVDVQERKFCLGLLETLSENSTLETQ